mmetsp:Transcript_1850/g.5333  ORF Transcript_1850/g.5333 Transcript_1850/m.5333 type:complete len:351 (-) Transcript_1850:38-1090(-)
MDEHQVYRRLVRGGPASSRRRRRAAHQLLLGHGRADGAAAEHRGDGPAAPSGRRPPLGPAGVAPGALRLLGRRRRGGHLRHDRQHGGAQGVAGGGVVRGAQEDGPQGRVELEEGAAGDAALRVGPGLLHQQLDAAGRAAAARGHQCRAHALRLGRRARDHSGWQAHHRHAVLRRPAAERAALGDRRRRGARREDPEDDGQGAQSLQRGRLHGRHGARRRGQDLGRLRGLRARRRQAARRGAGHCRPGPGGAAHRVGGSTWHRAPDAAPPREDDGLQLPQRPRRRRGLPGRGARGLRRRRRDVVAAAVIARANSARARAHAHARARAHAREGRAGRSPCLAAVWPRVRLSW